MSSLTETLFNQDVPQPDANGEFATPADGAKFMASLGIPQTPLNGKAPILQDWPNKASLDFAQIDAWYIEHNRCNFGSVAKAVPGGFCVFEADSTDVRRRFEADMNRRFTPTLIIQSREGRGHRWFKQTTESIELGNIAQNAVIGEDFSVRVSAEQCVSAGSVHPITHQQYRIAVNNPVAEISPEEIAWFKAQRAEQKKKEALLDEDAPILSGARNSKLASIAGKLREAGFKEDEIAEHLLKLNDTRCQPPLKEDEVRTIARSIARYPSGEDNYLLMGGKTAEQRIVEQYVNANTEPEVDTEGLIEQPPFPRWVMEGTSIYEGLVKPTTDVSAKCPEMLFMSSVQVMMNYLSGKIRLKQRHMVFNIYLGLIGPAGKFFKSSCCELSHEYFSYAGICQQYRQSTNNSEGKVQIVTAGSSEGFGGDMARINCKNAILYFDEFSKFVNKAGIESSSLASDVLTWYGAGKFSNSITNKKNTFSFEPGDYCFGWTWCTTNQAFNNLWSRLAGASSGLNDRMFFIVSPKESKELGLLRTPDLIPGAAKTRGMIDNALTVGVYDYEDYDRVEQIIKRSGINARAIELVEKMALYFAVDLQRSCIDEDCVERAIAVVAHYREPMSVYLAPIEAESTQGRIQQIIVKELRTNKGKMRYYDLKKNLHYSRYGTDTWNKAIKGLVDYKEVALKGRPEIAYLLKQSEAA